MVPQNIAKPFLIGAAATALMSCLAGYFWHEQQRPAVLEVYIFALKSGRSMFIRTPDDRRILVDGGANTQVISLLTDIIPFYSRRIDAVIVTNTDGSNVSGLIDVMSRYDVERVYVPKFTLENLEIKRSDDQIYETLVETLKSVGIMRVDEVESGDQIPLSGVDLGSDEHRATMHIVFPASPESFSYSKSSAPEILFSIEYGLTSITFMGDASVKVQKHIASNGFFDEPTRTSRGSHALIVSHSALEENISKELVDVLRPDYLIYDKLVRANSKNKTKSTDKNTKSKPNPLATILHENRFNLKEIGTVKLVSDGEVMVVGEGGKNKKAP
jgi:beta-lactamase superfamily II metal-dependent hydrolase